MTTLTYCHNCGAQLGPTKCPHCGQACIYPGFKHCPQCSAQLTGAKKTIPSPPKTPKEKQINSHGAGRPRLSKGTVSFSHAQIIWIEGQAQNRELSEEIFLRQLVEWQGDNIKTVEPVDLAIDTLNESITFSISMEVRKQNQVDLQRERHHASCHYSGFGGLGDERERKLNHATTEREMKGNDVYGKLLEFQQLCAAVDRKTRESKERKPTALKRLGVSAYSLRRWRAGELPSNASVKRLTPVFEKYLKEVEPNSLGDEIRQQLQRMERKLDRLCDAFLLDEDSPDSKESSEDVEITA